MKIAMEIKCPKCKSTLKRVEYEDLFIFVCPRGDGSWVNGNDLGEIVKRRDAKISQKIFKAVEKDISPKNIETQVLTKDIKCPICGADCEKINYSYSSGIIIDHCPNGCGVWLDSGELEKIQAFSEFWDKKATEIMAEKGIVLDFDDEAGRKRKGLFGNLLNSIYEKFLG